MSWLRDTFEIDHSSHPKNSAMEGLRGFAVFLVFLVHYVTLIEPWMLSGTSTAAVAATLRDIGNTGVDLFFVLSGYLIYGTLLEKPRPFLPYLQRRLQRIYPTFLVVLAVYLLLMVILPDQSKLPSDRLTAGVYVVQNLLLLPGMFAIRPIITVAWSLSFELFYYLAVPLAIGTLRLRTWSPWARITFFVLLAAGMFAASTSLGDHTRLAMFLAGILLHERLRGGRSSRIDLLGLAALVGGLAAVELIHAYALPGVLGFVALFVAFYVLCVACFSSAGRSSRIFSWDPLRWYGNMSYSYYLIHGLALKFAFLVLSKLYAPAGSSEALFWALMPLMFVFTLAVSAALFVLVEKPLSLAPHARGRPAVVRAGQT